MPLLTAPFVVAAAQVAPVGLDRAATLEKACELICDAGQAGARLLIFPEAFLPAYPDWAWAVPPGDEARLNALNAGLLQNAITVPSDATDKLCRMARRARTSVMMGISERGPEASSNLYNTLLYIDANGALLGRHRKLALSGTERRVWAPGDGNTLDVYDSPLGKIGGLIGSENYLLLARYALYTWGVQLYLAPTWEHGEPWLSTLRHIAREGCVYVIGNSAIVNPTGEVIAGPLPEQEGLVLAEIDPREISRSRWMLDVAEHYAHPGVFQFTVQRAPRHAIQPEAEVKTIRPSEQDESPGI